MFFCLLQYLSKYHLLQSILTSYGIEAGYNMPGARKTSFFLLGHGSHLGFCHSTISTSRHCYRLCSVAHCPMTGTPRMRHAGLSGLEQTGQLPPPQSPVGSPDHCPRASSQARSLAQFLHFPTLLATGPSSLWGYDFVFQFNHIYLFCLSETYNFWSSSVLTSCFVFCFVLFLVCVCVCVCVWVCGHVVWLERC